LITYELTRDALEGDGDFACVRGRYAITLLPVEASGPISDRGNYLEVWRREQDGAWRVAEAIWNTSLPSSAQASPSPA
jgi:ketosteroid isomerase-like protein